jgi:hypothetical protein
MQILFFINLAFAAQMNGQSKALDSDIIKYQEDLDSFKAAGNDAIARLFFANRCSMDTVGNEEWQKNWISELLVNRSIVGANGHFARAYRLAGNNYAANDVFDRDVLDTLNGPQHARIVLIKELVRGLQGEARIALGIQIVEEAIAALHQAKDATRRPFTGASLGFHGIGWRKHIMQDIMKNNNDKVYKADLKAEISHALQLYNPIQEISESQPISKQTMIAVLNNYVERRRAELQGN